jgi:ribosomal protein S18 acetylase RimI-like enzyme
MEIRPYQEADEEGVAALWREAFPAAPSYANPAAVVRQKLAVQRELFFVAVDGGGVAGTVMAGYDGHRGWLYSVAVRQRCRRQGVGSALVRHAEAALRQLGTPKINLQLLSTNHETVAFYESLGYKVEERISMGKRF